MISEPHDAEDEGDEDDDAEEDVVRCLECDAPWVTTGGYETCLKCGLHMFTCDSCGETSKATPADQEREMCEDCEEAENASVGVPSERARPDERGTHKEATNSDRCVICAEQGEPSALIFFTQRECAELSLRQGEGFYCSACCPDSDPD